MISRNSILVVLALAFVAPVAHADILYGVTGTYLKAYGKTFDDILPVPASPWIGSFVTDDSCLICTPGHGLLALNLFFGSPFIPNVDLASASVASYDRQRDYLVVAALFGTYLSMMQPQNTGITDLRSFWIDGYGLGDLAGTYTITPEPGSVVLLLCALALAAKLRPRLLPHAAHTYARQTVMQDRS